MNFVKMSFLTFGASILGMLIVRALHWPYWAYHVFVIFFGVFLYLINNFLIRFYIEKNAPEFASKETVIKGVQSWELTAGMGVVPKWVSFIGLLAIGFILASPFEFFAWLVRAFL